MFTLIQMTLEDTSAAPMKGSRSEMVRAMKSALSWADAAAVPFHAVLIDPAGRVVATA